MDEIRPGEGWKRDRQILQMLDPELAEMHQQGVCEGCIYAVAISKFGIRRMLSLIKNIEITQEERVKIVINLTRVIAWHNPRKCIGCRRECRVPSYAAFGQTRQIKALFNIVIKARDPRQATRFAKYSPGLDAKQIRALYKVAEGDPYWRNLFFDMVSFFRWYPAGLRKP